MGRIRTWGVFLLVCAGVAWADGTGRRFRRTVYADDGAAVTLFRYVPVGGGRTRAPVLLVPDLGFRRELFDLDGRGLAPWLAARGFEVYVLEPSAGRRPVDFARRDLPAVVAAIRAERPERIDLVAHGYAGTLAMVASTRELKDQIGKVVALSTPAIPEVPNRIAELLLAAGGRLTHLSLDPEGAASFDLLFAKHGRFPGRVLADLRATGVVDLGVPASAELLGWMKSGDLELGDGSTVKARLAHYDRPTLQFLPMRDNWAHPEFAAPLRDVARSAPIRLRSLSLIQFDTEDYTHLSLLQGDGAAQEVFEPLRQFLTGEVSL